MSIDHLNPGTMQPPTGYSYVVRATGSQIVHVSGQVAIDGQGRVVGEGDLALQGEQVFENLRTCLAAAGAGFKDVVKLTTYVVNYKPEDRATIGALRQRYLGTEGPPASTLVGVQALALPSLLIEIEAVAVLA